MTEEEVTASFSEIALVVVSSSKEIAGVASELRDVLEDSRKDWERRVAALKRLKGLVSASLDAGLEREMLVELRSLDVSLSTSAKDLRSAVCREAAYTIAFLATRLGNKLEWLAERVLDTLIHGIQNSAKVMASANELALRYVIRHCECWKLLPSITDATKHKSKEIRRAAFDSVGQVLSSWPHAALDRHHASLVACLKPGMGDSDSACRAAARDAFAKLETTYPAEAADLFSQLDAKQQKALRGPGGALSAASSTNSLAGIGRAPSGSATRPPAYARRPGGFGGRSTSEIDTGAARRAGSRYHRPPPAPNNHSHVQSSGYGQQNSLRTFLSSYLELCMFPLHSQIAPLHCHPCTVLQKDRPPKLTSTSLAIHNLGCRLTVVSVVVRS